MMLAWHRHRSPAEDGKYDTDEECNSSVFPRGGCACQSPRDVADLSPSVLERRRRPSVRVNVLVNPPFLAGDLGQEGGQRDGIAELRTIEDDCLEMAREAFR